MYFTSPGALLFAATAIPVVIFYILKVRRRRVAVSTVMFWDEILDQGQTRSIWRRLRHIVSLLVQLAIIALLVFAMTDPHIGNATTERQRLVVVLDASASMQAQSDAGTRFDAAKQYAQQLIRSLQPDDKMAIVAAGTSVTIPCGFIDQPHRLERALNRIAVTDGPTSVLAAWKIANRIVGDDPNAQIIVLTDGGFENFQSLQDKPNVTMHRFGQSVGNVGITKFQVRRDPTDRVSYQAYIEVINFDDEPMACRLDLDLGVQVVDAIPLQLDAGERWSHTIQASSAAGGILIARLDGQDALSIDNMARAVLPRVVRIPVTLVTEGNLFLQQALVASELVDLTVTTTVPETAPTGGLLVVHKTPMATVPAGNVFVVHPVTDSDHWEILGDTEFPAVTAQDHASPLMRNVSLSKILIPHAARILPHAPWDPLVATNDNDPLLLTIRRSQGNLIVLTVDLDEGDLPLRTAFPILMANALNWLFPVTGNLAPSVSVGESLELTLPDSLLDRDGADVDDNWILSSPDGTERSVPATKELVIGRLDQTGIWHLHPQKDPAGTWTQQQLQVACNLTNVHESNLRVPDLLSRGDLRHTSGFIDGPMWLYAVSLAVLLLFGEWFLFQRRWIS
jgi:von Willebrand factor type A domain/Aerotolerance regulator N-terminal